MKKYLIVHPQDPTTSFLCEIYKDLPNKTVITGGGTKNELRKEICLHDRIILCGHGSPSGLFGVGQFPADNGMIIGESMVESLKLKTNALYIWCNANQYIRRHSLYGFNTAMFISETSEAVWYDFYDVEQETIKNSGRLSWCSTM